MFLLHSCHNVSQCIQANSNLIKIGSFCTQKRLPSMPLANHTSPHVALPYWHPRRLAAPGGLRGLLFLKKEGWFGGYPKQKGTKTRNEIFCHVQLGAGGGGSGKGLAWCMVYLSVFYRAVQ